MGLRYILDGYNVIKSSAGSMFAGGTLEQQRMNLFLWLLDCHPEGSAQNSVAVVFDGKSENPSWYGGYSEQVYHGLVIRFSEGTSADDVIEEMVTGDPHPVDVVVVSNDKGLHRRLGGTGARCVSVESFLEKGRRRASPGPRRGMPPADAVDPVTNEMKKRWLK